MVTDVAAAWQYVGRAYIVSLMHPNQPGQFINTFVYGSLMFDAVWDILISTRYRKTEARLDGYARVRVRGEVYPGLVQAPGRSVNGILVNGVRSEDIAILDRFEGKYYKRVPVKVATGQGDAIRAETYLFNEQVAHLLTDSEWNVEEFALNGINAFLAEYRGFR